MLAICFVVIYTLAAPAFTKHPQAEASIVAPVLNVAIDSPANGSTVKVDNNFIVQASVTSIQILTFEKVHSIALANNVNAIQNVTLTISIVGPASTKEPLTKPANPSTLGPGQSGIASWTLHCDGPGGVTITVSPAGMFGSINGDPVVTRNSVLAGVGLTPIPSENLNSATVIIHQREDASSSSYSPNEPEYRRATDAHMATITVYAQPQQTVTGQPVTILGNIANRGESAGNYKATLKINGEIEEIKEGTLAGHMARPLEFTVYRDIPGTYKVDINGQQTYFTIVGPQQQNTNAISPAVIFIIIISALVALSLIVLLVRRLN